MSHPDHGAGPTRRTVLAKGAAGLGLTAGWAQNEKAIDMTAISDTTCEADVLVIGGGMADLFAAITACDGWGDMVERKPGRDGVDVRRDLGVDLTHAAYVRGAPVEGGPWRAIAPGGVGRTPRRGRPRPKAAQGGLWPRLGHANHAGDHDP